MRGRTTLALLLVTGACLASVGNTATSQTTTTFEVHGISAPAEILIDEWGVPHLYAATHYDAFFVQGFNAARDRLWQIDLWRHRGLGTLAEVLGEAYADQDIAARRFLYRGDMYREWLAYGSDAKRIAQAFTAGINAYVSLTETRPELLPPEFGLLDYAPSQWMPEDVVRIRSNGLWRNVTNEVRRARLACEADLAAADLEQKLEPDWSAQIPDGLDPCTIPENVLDEYLLAKAPVRFDRPDLALESARTEEAYDFIGSNNWVVAPDRTATGRPILADDPHRGHATPSLRYIAHLNAPGLNVIGAGEPALPGISIGHNEQIAFGLTIFPIDQEDLYVYTKSKDGYIYQGRVEPFEVITEEVNVRDRAARPAAMKFTRHGPVVFETKTHAYAVRAAWLDAGMSPYFGSVEYMRAQNWRSFVAALNRWGAPSENQVYADTDGNIGYKPAGLFPVRRSWDGLMPVPGDGRYEWDGYFDMDVLPEEYNPGRGYTGTANAMNLPDDYPIDTYRIGFEWSAPWRHKRLWEVLATQPSHTLDESKALQRDYTSILARRIVAILKTYKPQRSEAYEMLTDWDAELAADSGEAALFNVWYHYHLIPALIAESKFADEVTRLDTQVVLDLLTTADGQAAALASLNSAWQDTMDRLGDEPDAWRWGDLHQIRFAHPLHHLAAGDLQAAMTIKPYPRGGSANTTNNTGFAPDNFDVRAGASFRMVLDVGNWDAAKMTNAPGQSGDPRSPFYDNLLESWATEGDFPLLFSREAIEAHTVQRILLKPTD